MSKIWKLPFKWTDSKLKKIPWMFCSERNFFESSLRCFLFVTNQKESELSLIPFHLVANWPCTYLGINTPGFFISPIDFYHCLLVISMNFYCSLLTYNSFRGLFSFMMHWSPLIRHIQCKLPFVSSQVHNCIFLCIFAIMASTMIIRDDNLK